jgi:predicted RNase H-like HicB family nuclease
VNRWKRFKFHVQGRLIGCLNSLMNLLVDKPPEPNPDALERTKAAKTHSFVVRLEWNDEDQTYYAYIPELEVMTNADSLPEALYMAGDAGKLVLEHDMAWNQYPPMPERVKG